MEEGILWIKTIARMWGFDMNKHSTHRNGLALICHRGGKNTRPSMVSMMVTDILGPIQKQERPDARLK